MGLLLRAAERLSLGFFADGANVARTEAALTAARAVYGRPFAAAVASGERRAADVPSAPMGVSRDVATTREALGA